VYSTMMNGILSGRCPEVTAADTANMFRAIAQLPANTDPRSARFSQAQYFVGFSALGAGDVNAALDAFDRSLQSRPGAGHAMLMAAQLATFGHYDEALHFSDIALRQFDKVADELLPAERIRREDILAFQDQVRADRDAVPGGGGSDPER
jgi:tetratricopeptide (TPR) repeat protein